MRRAAFLDRDGTIIHDAGYLADAEGVVLIPGAIAALKTFRDRGFILVVVSNQSGVPRGLITTEQHIAVSSRVSRLLAAEGVPLFASYYCMHLPTACCSCRKPKPGMLKEAARDHGIDLGGSFMVGDRMSDVEAGRAAGCMTALLAMSSSGAASWESAPDHRAENWPSLLASLEGSWNHSVIR